MKIFNYELRKIHKGTALHPDYKKLIEFAFEIDGEEYYAFKTIADMPSERYYKSSEFMVELELRIKRETLLSYLTKMEELGNQGNFGKMLAIIEELKYRTEMLIETETLYRLASCVFFTLDEDITGYDIDYNDEKIAKFKKQKIDSFFLKEPVSRFIPLAGISAEDLALCLKLSEVRNRYANYLMQ